MTPAFARAASPWANLADPIFTRVDTRGLPEQAVMAIAQDSTGFLWIGTQGGLARFDGYQFQNYLPNADEPNALPDGYVRTLLAGADGAMWIGTSTSGLCLFDPSRQAFRTWRPDPTGRTGPHSAEVDTLANASGGKLWVGGDGGLDLFDPRTGRFVRAALQTAGQQPVVWNVLVTRRGGVWVATQRGLYHRLPARRRFRAFVFPNHIGTPPIYALFEDSADRLWAASVNAVYGVGRSRRTVVALRSVPGSLSTLAPGQQWAIAEPRPGTLWIGADSAISIVDERTFAVRRALADPRNPGGLTLGRAVQFFVDRSGLLWVANHVGGLLLYNARSRGLYVLSATRQDAGAVAGALAVAAQPDGRLWTGGFSGALALLSPRQGRSSIVTVPNRSAVQTLLRGPHGTLWIGTTSGLCAIPAGRSRPECPAGPRAAGNASIYAILRAGRHLWIGGSNGLLDANMATGRVRTYEHGTSEGTLSNNQVRALYLDRRGHLWIGTENGLNRLDARGHIARFLFDPHDPRSLGSGGITSIVEDGRGRIWAGAEGGPLNVLEESSRRGVRFVHLSRRDGLPHENVDALAVDPRGRIWASTDSGIAVIDPATLKAHAFLLPDGISDDGYWAGAAAESADGTIFFGGLDGVTIVTPNAASNWRYAPPIVASALQIGHRAAKRQIMRSRIVLQPDKRDLSLEFSALDYSAPSSLLYAYKLDGYDRNWVYTDSAHRIATYTHLPPGSYSLNVRGTNRVGVWSTRTLQLRIRALPEWYETWWFKLLGAALLVFAAYGAHRLRTSVLRERQRDLEATVAARTRELSQANDKLQQMSLNDPLTGLRNRRFITQHLQADAALTIRRYEHWLSHPAEEAPDTADLTVFLVDIDHFKPVNDRYGHQNGDALLLQICDRLRGVFRESDFLARWGGDEFLAVARGSSRRKAPEIAERIRDAVASAPFALDNGQSLEKTVSVGFASFPFLQADPGAAGWHQVIDLADRALYQAKQNGRNTWCEVRVSTSDALEAQQLEFLAAPPVTRSAR